MSARRGQSNARPSRIVSLRMPLDQIERLDRYLDIIEERTGVPGSRNLAMRRALDEWLDRQEKAMDIPPPESAAPKRPRAPKKRTTEKKSTPRKGQRKDP